MFCSKCGNQGDERFCRKCGTDLENPVPGRKEYLLVKESVDERFATARSKDPDELTGNGVGSVFVGDGFFYGCSYSERHEHCNQQSFVAVAADSGIFLFRQGLR